MGRKTTSLVIHRSTGEPWLDLIAAVYRLALYDARRGNPSAIRWLDDTYPGWRRLAKQPKRQVTFGHYDTIKKE